MKSIIIPVDEHSESTKILEKVIHLLCRSEECRIVLLHSYLVPISTPDNVIAVNDEMKKKSREILVNRREFLQNEFQTPRINIETESHLGTLGNVLSRLLQKEKFDLLVTGPDTVTDSFRALLREYKCSHLTINP